MSSLPEVVEPIPLLPRCGACGLYRTCKSPKMPWSGEGRRGVLLLGEAPGTDEDKRGIQFWGVTGRFLEESLREFGVDMRRDCWLTNSIICRPPRNKTPTDNEISHCLPNLVRCVKELQPRVIIPLGARAVRSLIGWVWGRSDVGGMPRWDGWRIPAQSINAWICPTWHPSYVLRNREEARKRLGHLFKERGKESLQELFWEPRLKAAFELEGRPWPGGEPDYDRKVRVLLDVSEATKYLEQWSRLRNHPNAFDFETNMLKPDSPDARIVSCAVSDGIETIAYPWHGKAIEATRVLLRSSVPKIGFNVKFEERWTLKEFGHGVRNWAWDGMLAAHVLDNRPDICSLEFQAFVLLGQRSWEGPAKPYKIAAGSNVVNRMGEMDLRKLLEYNGLDALIEYEVAKVQRRQFK